MSIVALTTAKAHLRLESEYPDEQVQGKLDAAERLAAEFLNRRIYQNDAALTAAIATVPDALVAAGAAYRAALTAAEAIDDCVAERAAKDYALRAYRDAQTLACETYAGIVINQQIEAAILLTLGHLFENRQGSQQLPDDAVAMLFYFRVGLGA
ncbi:MAG TPA: head-tail connector protein [Variovorax sp.]|nr:head-tail connector protein [Variovorax sp.]